MLDRDEKFFCFPKFPHGLLKLCNLVFKGYDGCVAGVKRFVRVFDLSSLLQSKEKECTMLQL